jgi:hypothetical protein
MFCAKCRQILDFEGEGAREARFPRNNSRRAPKSGYRLAFRDISGLALTQASSAESEIPTTDLPLLLRSVPRGVAL